MVHWSYSPDGTLKFNIDGAVRDKPGPTIRMAMSRVKTRVQPQPFPIRGRFNSRSIRFKPVWIFTT